MVRVIIGTDYSYLYGKARDHLIAGSLIALLALVSTIVPSIGFFIAGALLLIAIGQFSSWTSYNKGICGERRVNQALRKLCDDYVLLEDIKLYDDSGNIDHIVIGPNGVFVLETKNYSGLVSCYGDKWYQRSKQGKKSFEIESVSHQAKSCARLLKGYLQGHLVGGYLNRLFIVPIIVFANSNMKLKTRDPTVPVTTHKKVVKSILKTDTGLHLSAGEVQQIASVICKKTY